MTRRQWMWLWIWLLLFFMIFCIWNKLQAMDNTQHLRTTSTATKPMKKENKVQQIPIIDVIPPRDMSIKIIKQDDSIKISGIFSSQRELDNLKGSYKKTSKNIKEGTIIIDKNVKNSNLLVFIPTLTDEFSKFKNGYIEYNDKVFTIDGVVESDEVKNNLDKKLTQAKNFSTNNNTVVEKPLVSEKVAIQESLIKKIIDKKPSKLDIQKELDKLLKGKKVEFIYARTILTPKSKKIVNKIQIVLKKYTDVNVEIGGHTDSDGTKQNNKKLSQKRADAIKKYLVSKEIDAKRLKAIGYGEDKPLVKNDSAAKKQINRRVEFKVIGE